MDLDKIIALAGETEKQKAPRSLKENGEERVPMSEFLKKEEHKGGRGNTNGSPRGEGWKRELDPQKPKRKKT